MNNNGFSIIIISDNNFFHAYKTIKSTISFLESENVSYEIFVEERYETALKGFKDNKHIVFYDREKDFIEKIKFCNVAIIRAGNHVSNFLTKNTLEQLNNIKEPAVFYPEYKIRFGFRAEIKVFFRNSETLKNLLIEKTICGCVCLDEALLTKKGTLLSVIQDTTNNTYDAYLFNKVILESDINIFTIKNSAVFYRESREKNASSERVFNNLMINDIDSHNTAIKGNKKDKTFTRIYKKIRSNRGVNYVAKKISRVRRCIKRKDLEQENNNVPNEVISAWKILNRYESDLYPSNNLMANMGVVSEVTTNISDRYFKLVRYCQKPQNYIFFVPWVVRGGGDKVLINYLKAFAEIKPNWSITVIATQPSENEWSSNLPSNTSFIDFGNITDGLTDQDKDILMTRLISHTKCKNLHIINSGFGFEWVIKHGEELKKRHYNINASSFCYDYIPGTNYEWQVEFADPYIVEGYDVINRIFTDNKAIIEFDAAKNGFDPKKSTVHYQPIIEGFVEPKNITSSGQIRILWAGRIAEQKLPKVLLEIGKKLDGKNYHIDVYGYFYDHFPKNMFDGIEGITYRGPFNGFRSIDINQYDALLYTSIIDGVPNIILEAIAAGLPVVASDSGGIKEVIKEKSTGYIVHDKMSPNAYLEKFSEIRKDPKAANRYARNAQELLSRQHSWKQFVKSVQKDIIDML